jgi:peptidoglycan hydrolase CwlO-like protein
MSTRHSLNSFSVFLLASSFWLLASSAHAQTIQCDTPAQKAQCQVLYDQTVAEQKQAESDLATAKAKSSSLTNDIAVLTARIKAAQLDIQAKNLLIQTLGNDITVKQSHINDLETSIAAGKQSLAALLRRTNELDQYSLPEVILSQSTVSGFFQDVDQFQAVQQGLENAFNQLRSDEVSTSAAKDALTTRQNAEEDARYEVQQQQKNIQADQAQQKQLLTISKGNEKAYTTLAAQKAVQAAQILAALFPLAGAKAIPFGDALNYANAVYQKTGVQPAFLLAMLKQETNIGANVGTCYLTDTADGSGINTRNNAYVGNVMKPGRDVQPFLSITSSLGYDYKTTPVSCPQSIGYGGGMGPAQFIASTWTLLIDRISAALGISTPNPWKPLDSFTAAGLYMYDLGGTSASPVSTTAQKNAACKYYSGRACGYVSGATAYANNILSMAYSGANSIQSQINAVQGY